MNERIADQSRRKSQLAIEYAYQTREQRPGTWVFWVFASDATRFRQSFSDIADRLKLAGRHDPRTDVYKLVDAWLSEQGPWLLILDNADDTGFLFENAAYGNQNRGDGGIVGTGERLRDHLPQCEHGTILITSRNRAAVRRLVESFNVVSVPPMEQAAAAELLRRKVGSHAASSREHELVDLLEHMPLAIVQAAALIGRRAPRYSVAQFIDDFKTSERKRGDLLSYEGGGLRRDRQARNSIMLTWQISYEYIENERPFAARLLSLMSLFDRQSIPEHMLRNGWRAESRAIERDEKAGADRAMAKANSGDDDDSEQDEGERSDHDVSLGQDRTECTFDEDIQLLRDFSFVTAHPDGKHFSMHKLVQLATRAWLQAHGSLESYRQLFVQKLRDEFPESGHERWARCENWAKCEGLMPHVQSAIDMQPEGMAGQRNWATVMYRAAQHAVMTGRAREAERLSMKAWETRSKVLGPDHLDTIDSVTMAGRALLLQERWQEVEQLQLQVIQANVKVLGNEHPDTLASIAELATTYSWQWRPQAAQALQQQVVEMSRRVHGDEHPETLASAAHLAMMYRQQGRLGDAEALQKQTMETSVRVHGNDHPSTLANIACLTLIYGQQGRWPEAQALTERAIEISGRVHGIEHPNTLAGIVCLAFFYYQQGRPEDAEVVQKQAIEAGARAHGVGHPSTLANIAHLVWLYEKQGRWEDAEAMQTQAADTSVRVYGKEHLHALASVAHLASLYGLQERWQNAEMLQKQVLETSMGVYGDGHSFTLASAVALAMTYHQQGRWDDAEILQRQAIETGVRVFGAGHPSTLGSIAHLAVLCGCRERWEDAEKIQEGAVEISVRVHGSEHPATLESVACLALIRNLRVQWREFEVLRQQMEVLRQQLDVLEHQVEAIEQQIEAPGQQAVSIEIGIAQLGSMYQQAVRTRIDLAYLLSIRSGNAR